MGPQVKFSPCANGSTRLHLHTALLHMSLLISWRKGNMWCSGTQLGRMCCFIALCFHCTCPLNAAFLRPCWTFALQAAIVCIERIGDGNTNGNTN